MLLAGSIKNWRFCAEGKICGPVHISASTLIPPPFNGLFAALYDLTFTKLTNRGYLIPSQFPTPSCMIKKIFKEKTHGTEKFLVSAELIAYLK